MPTSSPPPDIPPVTAPGGAPDMLLGAVPGVPPGTVSGAAPGVPLDAVSDLPPGTVSGGAPGVPLDAALGVPPDAVSGVGLDAPPGMLPEAAPDMPRDMAPGVPPDAVPGVRLDAVPGMLLDAVPGVPLDAVSGVRPGAAPEMLLDAVSGVPLDAVSGVRPGAAPEMLLDAVSGVPPDAVSGVRPGAAPGMLLDAVSGVPPDAVSGVRPGAAPKMPPDMSPDMLPDAVSGVPPDAVPDLPPDTARGVPLDVASDAVPGGGAVEPAVPGDVDVLVVGSGFGGSATALRLAEKGYRVAVLEAGRRFADTDFPRTSWRVRDYLFAPRLGCRGILRATLLGRVLVLSGAGVGGGSLGYANTLYDPPPPFYAGTHWASITDWRTELAPYYDQARRMLGVTPNPRFTPSDRVLKDAAREMGREHTFRTTPVGVHFGPPGTAPGATVPDPYFGGAGPARAACLHCGACMTGCRHNAKNTLPKNYLGLAEAAGVTVVADRTVTGLRPHGAGSATGWTVTSVRTGRGLRRDTRTTTARHVVLAAGALGTQRLLHRLRAGGALPGLSPRLGHLTRTNSEAILAVRSRDPDADFTRGVAITSSVHLDDTTHVEPVRYGPGSDLLALLGATLTDPVPGRPRLLAGLAAMAANARALPALHRPRRWARQAVVLLVMQSADNSLTTRLRRGPFGSRLTSRPGEGEPSPTWIPAGHRLARTAARQNDALACGTWGDLLDIPATGHLIGGCTVGADAEHGVVDPYHRVHGHPGLHIVDGSTVSANLGVNPSLTITALAERAAALWPNRGDADPRPEPGAPYRRVDPVAPRHPAVPAHAPAALRLGAAAPRPPEGQDPDADVPA